MTTVNTREAFLIEVSKMLPARNACVELGVLRGDFSQTILDIIRPRHLFLVDPFKTGTEMYSEELNNLPTAYSTDEDYINVLKRFIVERYMGQVKVVNNYSYEVVILFPNKAIDFIYHDASHKHEHLKRDLNEWLPKLKPGGVMAGHDYIIHPGFGVIAAVDEFIKDHAFEMIIFNQNGGDWALRRKHE